MLPTWKRTWRRILGVVALVAAIYALLLIAQGGLSSGPAQISLLIDLLLFGVGFLLWIFVLAHFVLPLGRPMQALDVAFEMIRALLGRQPAAAFIKDGEAASGIGQRARLLLLDGASAAVLHNQSAYTRAVGPGLSVARNDEIIAGTLDLRKQRRSLGPLPEEDPFAPQGRDESQVAYQSRQHRRSQTSALTHDDVEVAARIEVELRLEGRESQGGSAFGFNADSAWRAIAHEAMSAQTPSDARGRTLSWDWLPVHLAADVWRETLRKFNLTDLFEQKFDKQTTLEFIESRINQRLQQAIVAELDERGRATERQTSSPEYQMMRSRGLRVLQVNIREVHLEREQAEAQRVAEWAETWEQRGKQVRQTQGAAQADDAVRARSAGAINIVRRSSGALYQRLLKTDGREVPPPDEKETLELLLSGAIEAAGSNEKIRQLAIQLKDRENG
jgi:hypothetical protein